MKTIGETIKDYCGIPEDDTGFDTVLQGSLSNSVLALSQLNSMYKPKAALADAWSSIGVMSIEDPAVSYVCARARLDFDPPASTQIMDAIHRFIGETEFRIQIYTGQ